MKKLKAIPPIFGVLILVLTLMKCTTAQTSDEMQMFFSKEYAGISIKLNATSWAIPGGNMTIALWINCTAASITVEYLNLSVYGYKHFRYGVENRYGVEKATMKSACVLEKRPLSWNFTKIEEYTIPIPVDVWDLTYTELRLKYTIADLNPKYEEIFPITTVKNVLWEDLETKLDSLNKTYLQLNNTFTQLNQTYWSLLQNYTALQGSLNELDNTRRAVAILAITTVFFVATTVFMVMRKPKEHW